MTIRPLTGVSVVTRQRAKFLRRAATAPEKALWTMLRDRQLGGFKFRRQHPIEPYVVDFYCARARLVVELDGESHDGRREFDERRSSFLRRLGLHVIRFSNDDVLEYPDVVAEVILQHVSRLVPPSAVPGPSPNPSPQGRGTAKATARTRQPHEVGSRTK